MKVCTYGLGRQLDKSARLWLWLDLKQCCFQAERVLSRCRKPATTCLAGGPGKARLADALRSIGQVANAICATINAVVGAPIIDTVLHRGNGVAGGLQLSHSPQAYSNMARHLLPGSHIGLADVMPKSPGTLAWWTKSNTL